MVLIAYVCKDRVGVVVVAVIFHRLLVFFADWVTVVFPSYSEDRDSYDQFIPRVDTAYWAVSYHWYEPRLKCCQPRLFGSVLVLSQIQLHPFFGVASMFLIGNDYRSVQTRSVTHLSCRWSPLGDEYCMGQSAIIMFPLNHSKHNYCGGIPHFHRHKYHVVSKKIPWYRRKIVVFLFVYTRICWLNFMNP